MSTLSYPYSLRTLTIVRDEIRKAAISQARFHMALCLMVILAPIATVFFLWLTQGLRSIPTVSIVQVAIGVALSATQWANLKKLHGAAGAVPTKA